MDDEQEEEEEEDHGVQYEDDDDEGIFVDEEVDALQNMMPTLTVKKGENGTGGKITINNTALLYKCCCGRNDSYHKAHIPSGIQMNHTCNRCKKPCYGLCTEDYKCFKCLYLSV